MHDPIGRGYTVHHKGTSDDGDKLLDYLRGMKVKVKNIKSTFWLVRRIIYQI